MAQHSGILAGRRSLGPTAAPCRRRCRWRAGCGRRQLAERHRRHPVGVAGERVADRGGRWPGPTAAPSGRRCRWRAGCGRRAAGRTPPPVTAPVWPVSGSPTGVPVAGSHSRTVLSSLPVASRVRPSGSGRTPPPVTAPVWPVSGSPSGLAGGRVPQPHRAVVAAGGEQGAAVGQRPNATAGHRAGVAGERVAERGGRWPGPTAAPSRRRCRWRAGCGRRAAAERHRRSPRRCGR